MLPPCFLPVPTLVTGTGTGRPFIFSLSMVSEGPRVRTSATLGLSSADGLHGCGALPTQGLCV